MAEVEVRAASVTLRVPWRQDRKLCDVSVHVVLVTEVDPPKGDTRMALRLAEATTTT